MKGEQASVQLVDELHRLREQVEELTGRVRRLEGPARPSAPPPEEHEGTFGPAIRHTRPQSHLHAVNKALTMLGVLRPEGQERESGQRYASHRHALERIGRLRKDRIPTAEAGEAEQQAATAVDLVPLPELADSVERQARTDREPTAPVELEGAIRIDLAHPKRSARTADLFLLLAETALIAGILIEWPGPLGVLAALPLLALLSMRWWGSLRPVFLAHARFLALVLLARCLVPDMRTLDVQQPWWNLRFAAMVAACIPAVVVVYFRRTGWGVLALAMSAVFGAAVGAELGSLAPGLSIGAVLFGASILWRGVARVRTARASARVSVPPRPSSS